MPLPITSVAVMMLTFIFTHLSLGIVRYRSKKSALSRDAHLELSRLMHAHGNFAEFAPLAIILLAVLEIRGIEASLLVGLAALLILGRAAHASGILKGKSILRPIGMYATLIMLGTSTLLLITHSFVDHS